SSLMILNHHIRQKRIYGDINKFGNTLPCLKRNFSQSSQNSRCRCYIKCVKAHFSAPPILSRYCSTRCATKYAIIGGTAFPIWEIFTVLENLNLKSSGNV